MCDVAAFRGWEGLREGHRIVERADIEEARHNVEGACVLGFDPHEVPLK